MLQPPPIGAGRTMRVLQPFPESASKSQFSSPRWGAGWITFLERHLARGTGAAVGLLSCVAFITVLGTQAVVYPNISCIGLLPFNATTSMMEWLRVLANTGLSLVVIGTATVALQRFPIAVLIGTVWLLVSHGILALYHGLAMPVFSDWLCGLLGISGASINHVVIGDEVTQTCLIFLQDVTQMIGATMLGVLVFQLDRSARLAGASILALAAWSLFDLTVSALLTGPILYWSDLAFTLLCAIQCGVSAAWFWSRFRTLPRPANASLNSGLQQRAHGPLGRSEVR